jgi:hypothetical protein
VSRYAPTCTQNAEPDPEWIGVAPFTRGAGCFTGVASAGAVATTDGVAGVAGVGSAAGVGGVTRVGGVAGVAGAEDVGAITAGVAASGAGAGVAVVDCIWTDDESGAMGMGPTGGGAASARCEEGAGAADGWATVLRGDSAGVGAAPGALAGADGATSLTTKPGVTTAATSRAIA